MTAVRQLAQRVVDKLEVARAKAAGGVEPPTLDEVLGVLRMYGVPEAAPPPPQRHLRLLRLRMRGVKTLHGPDQELTAADDDPAASPDSPADSRRDRTGGAVDGGVSFDRTLIFGPGLTMITGPNFRGKTTVLEVLTLMLRGSRRGLQQDAARWLREVSLDVEVGTRILGLRVSMRDGAVIAGTVLEGSPEALAQADGAPAEPDSDAQGLAAAGISEVATVHDEERWTVEVEQLMLDTLALEPISAYTRVGGRTVGTLSAHGWKAYFFALYPPPGASSHLLADGTVGLASRLLDVFLDLPGATLRARLESASKYIAATDQARKAEAEATADNVQRRLADAEAALARSQAAAEAAATATAGLDVQSLRDAVNVAGRAHLLALQRLDETREQLQVARKERQQAQRELNRLEESVAARVLLHALNPKSCPRCEAPVDQQRRDAETDHHQCAVCTRPVATEDSEQQAEHSRERQEQAQAALDAAEQLRQLHQQGHEAAQGRERQAELALQEAEQTLQEAEVSDAHRDLELAKRAVTLAEGAVEALRSLAVPEQAADPRLLITETAVQLLRADTEAAFDALHSDLDAEITDLARQFGITNLDSVIFKRNLTMKVAKGGAPAENFGDQTAGERLRLRYALLVALLRIGNRRGISAHPGLLLLDSLRAEEVQQDDAQQLAEALAELCLEDGGPQVLTTTEDASLPSRLSVAPSTLGPSNPDGSLF